MYSHCELSLPSAGDQLSELDHFVDGSEFRTRDLILQNVEFKVVSWFFMVFGWFPWFFKVSRWIFIVINGPRLVKSELSAAGAK